MRPLALACVFVVASAQLAAADVVFKLTDAKGAPVADAVVSLVPLDAPAKVTPSAEPIEIIQSGEEFSTFVTPLVVGSTVVFQNADKVGHQIYSLSPPKKFALPLHKPGTAPSVIFDRPGIVALGCNIHYWMAAYVVVLETPWFAKSGATGAAIVPVPPGRYRAEVWQARLAKIETREITIAAGATVSTQSFTLTLKPERRIPRRVESSTGGYK